jgi:hypothetical protein
MEIILFILLIGVWAAFVVPAFVNSRREAYLNATTEEPVRSIDSPLPSAQAAEARAQVLARRKAALVILALIVVGTLVGAIVTGSTVLLVATLAADVALAGYVALLLTIKQRQQAMPAVRTGRSTDEARVASR